MSDRQEPTRTEEERRREAPAERDAAAAERGANALTRTLLRVGLAIVGFILLLFALDQAFGLALLDGLIQFLNTSTGRWVLVAFVGLLLILIAMGGWRYRGRYAA